MRNKFMKKFMLLFLALFFASTAVFAQEAIEEPIVEPVAEAQIVTQSVSIKISNGENELEFLDLSLAPTGTVSIQDSAGGAHDIDARSVLAMLFQLDKAETGFKTGELIYYPSFGALYLRCMKVTGVEKCDNWLYEVNGVGPSVGMDSFILKDGDSVEIYYDDSFFGGGNDEEEVVEEEPVQEVSRSSGRVRRKVESTPETELVEVVLAVSEPEPLKPLVPAYIAFPEFYTPQEITEPKVSANLSAAATESDFTPSSFMYVLLGLVAITLVAIFRN